MLSPFNFISHLHPVLESHQVPEFFPYNCQKGRNCSAHEQIHKSLYLVANTEYYSNRAFTYFHLLPYCILE